MTTRASQSLAGPDDGVITRAPGAAGLPEFLRQRSRRAAVGRASRAGPGRAARAGIADRRMRDDQVAAPASSYHVIRYDQHGFGRSNPPGAPYSPVADRDAVHDYAGAGQAALAGCSLRGAITIEYALAHPARVTGLVPVAARRPRRHPKTIEPGPDDEPRMMGRSALGHLLPAT
jgi:pimeloyl-ACP methyl ester carboxylesterase